MAVRLEAANAGYLAYPTGINLKPALSNTGLDQGYGHFCAGFVELPWAPGSNIASFLWGHDANKDGSWTQAGADHFLTMGGPNTGGSPSMKNRIVTSSALSGAVNGWPAATRNWSGMTPRTRSAMGESRVYLVGHGILNLGTAGTPDWRFFRFAWPQSGGSAANDTYIDATSKTNADGYVAGATTFLSQIFNSANSVPYTAVEWLGVFRGLFPTTGTVGGGDYALDTSVLQDLIDGVKTYKNQTALRVWAGAAASIIDLRPLINGDLTAVSDSTSTGKATALVPTGTTASINSNAGVIMPSWSDISVAAVMSGGPGIGFWGGRGAVAPLVRGRKLSGVQLQCRVEGYSSGVALSGFDWQDMTSSGSTDWTATLPASPPEGGPYRLRIRNKAIPSVEASTGAPIYVGCVVAHWGQSQVELGFNVGTPYDASVANNCWGLMMIDEGGAQNQQALSGSAYTRPSGAIFSLNAADSPQRAGLVAFVNEWAAHSPSAPLLVVCMGLKTYGLYNLWAPEGNAWRGEGLSLPPNMPGAPTSSSWYAWGNNLNLPGPLGGANSGLVTAEALFLDRYLDVILFDLGTADATLAKPSTPAQYANWGNGAYQDWESNFAACANYLRGTFFTRSPSVPILIAPFGRYNTSAAEAWKLRDKQYLYGAAGTLNTNLACFLGDGQMDYGSVGSPHPRNGYSATSPPAGVNNEVKDEGQQRRMRRLARGVCRYYDTSVSVMGPRMTSWWRDPSDTTVAWIETGWTAGLKTQSGPPYTSQDLPEFYFSADGTWGTVEASYHATINPTGQFYARLDPAYPTRIKLTRKSGAASWPATPGVATIEYCRSSIFDSSAGTKFQEKDTLPVDQASATIRALDGLNLLVYGDAANDGGRGLMLRQAFGTINSGGGLLQSAVPTLGKFKVVQVDKVVPGTYNLTLVRRDASGSVVATVMQEFVIQ